MIELPRGYKLKKRKKNSSENYHEVYVSLQVPPKYNDLTLEDVEYINDNCIQPIDCIFLGKMPRGRIYVVAFDVQTKKIDIDKFIENIPERFRRIIRAWRQKEC